jgi:hypothetical protein
MLAAVRIAKLRELNLDVSPDVKSDGVWVIDEHSAQWIESNIPRVATTMLIFAAQQGNATVAAILAWLALRHNIPYYILHKDAQNLSAIQWAVHRGHADVVAAIRRACPEAVIEFMSPFESNVESTPSKRREIVNAALSTGPLYFQAPRGNLLMQFLKEFIFSFTSPQQWPFTVLVTSILISLYFEVAYSHMGIDVSGHLALYIFQLCIWCCFFCTKYADLEPIPDQCFELYPMAMKSLCDSFEHVENAHWRGSPKPVIATAESLCHICGVVQPLHCRHSYTENRCILNFDHYCVFVGAPIHSNNYTWFMLFILVMLLSMPSFVYTLSTHADGTYTFGHDAALEWFILWTKLMWLCTIGFAFVHTYLLYIGFTTDEYLRQYSEKNIESRSSAASSQISKTSLLHFHNRFNFKSLLDAIPLLLSLCRTSRFTHSSKDEVAFDELSYSVGPFDPLASAGVEFSDNVRSFLDLPPPSDIAEKKIRRAAPASDDRIVDTV